ncbi:hypothetical protein VNI00_014206 [Paramarasmius palmivorus]|uniref:Uncharacterized protein n=1 Tax=Paramarasmius palmivorus TaxID=297713 RepID=A0AAW0BWL5_9AGAR
MYLTRRVTSLFTPLQKAGILSGAFNLDDVVWERMFNPIEELRNVDPDFAGLEFQDLEEPQRMPIPPSKRPHDDLDDDVEPPNWDWDDDSNDGPFEHESLPRKPLKTQKTASKGSKKRKRPQGKKTASKVVNLGASSSTPPKVEYQSSFQLPPQSFTKAGLSMQERKHARSTVRRQLGRQTLLATTGFIDVEKDTRLSSTGWMGVNANSKFCNQVKDVRDNGGGLKGITLIFYERVEIFICDSQGRIVIYRSAVTDNMKRRLLLRVIEEAENFQQETSPPTHKDCEDNAQGFHWFKISGFDRNNKS